MGDSAVVLADCLAARVPVLVGDVLAGDDLERAILPELVLGVELFKSVEMGFEEVVVFLTSFEGSKDFLVD